MVVKEAKIIIIEVWIPTKDNVKIPTNTFDGQGGEEHDDGERVVVAKSSSSKAAVSAASNALENSS